MVNEKIPIFSAATCLLVFSTETMSQAQTHILLLAGISGDEAKFPL